MPTVKDLISAKNRKLITVSNVSCSTGGSVALENSFNCFSGLANGEDYYMNSSASGVTIDPTFQKVGRSINATTITKGF